jgi:hypothetical protein
MYICIYEYIMYVKKYFSSKLEQLKTSMQNKITFKLGIVCNVKQIKNAYLKFYNYHQLS